MNSAEQEGLQFQFALMERRLHRTERWVQFHKIGWTLLAGLVLLLLGTNRFGEFQKRLGLAKNILTVRLRALVDQGILKTAPASDGSAYQDYLLTPKGRGVFPVLVALRQWSEEFDERPEEIATILVDKENGRPVRKLELYSEDGRLLTQADTALKPRPGGKQTTCVTA